MKEVQSWLTKSSSSSSSSSSAAAGTAAVTTSTCSCTTSPEAHTTPTLCEEIATSFISLKSHDHDHPNKNNPKIPGLIESIASLKAQTPQIISCLSVHNSTLLYAASINEINVYELTNRYALIDTFGSTSSCSGSIKSIEFADKKIFTAHQDSKIRVWQLVSESRKHRLIATLPTFKDRFYNSFSSKNYVEVRRHKQKLWVEHGDAVSGLAVNNDNGLMYSISWDRSFKIWKTSSDMHCLESVKAHSDAVNAITISSFDGTVYTASADGCIKVWKIMSIDKKIKHKLLSVLTKHESSVNALALTSDGSVLYSGGGDQIILAWERDNINNIENYDMVVNCELKGHNGAILCLKIAKNGVLISGSCDKTVRIWKHEKGSGVSCLGILKGHEKPVKSLVAVSSEDLDDSFSVFSGSLDGEIRVWKVKLPITIYIRD